MNFDGSFVSPSDNDNGQPTSLEASMVLRHGGQLKPQDQLFPTSDLNDWRAALQLIMMDKSYLFKLFVVRGNKRMLIIYFFLHFPVPA